MRAVRIVAMLCLACGATGTPKASGTPTGISPPPLSGQPGPVVVQVACGDFHSCATMSDHTVRCWGRNKSAELGDGTGYDRSRPTQVVGVSGVVEIALGANFTCARMADGTVSCWGSGRILGDRSIADRIGPTKVPGVRNAIELRAGGYMTCVRDKDNAIACWGLEARAAAPKGVRSLSVAAAHACARVDGDEARCWGEGIWGESASPSFSKPGLLGVQQIDTGDTFACALIAGGAISCWGQNEQSELGIQPDEDNHLHAAPVPGIRGAIALTSNESHSCAVLSAGNVSCWGSNTEGELARGTQSTGETPGEVKGLSDVVEVDMGADHACARTKSDVYCWGANRSGQLGDGTTEPRMTPVKVVW